MNADTHEDGMTLIEMLVALALLGLLSVGMISTFRIAEHTYRQVVRVEQSVWEVMVAQRAVRRLLESAYPFDIRSSSAVHNFGLEGSADVLAVTARPPQSSNGGYRRYELRLVPGKNQTQELIVRTTSDWTGGTEGSQDEVLIERIASAEWAYLEPADLRGPTASDRQWLSTWQGERKLPALVRLRVIFPAGDVRAWPELLVTPRITDDANCEFDVVGQVCREAGS